MVDSKKSLDQSVKVAGRVFKVSDYQDEGTLAEGLATVHEQVSDAYAEGEILAVIDDMNGEDIQLNKRFDKNKE